MRKIILAVLLGFFIVGIGSCSKEEDTKKSNCLPGYGWLKISNGSLTTVHRVLIDGTNYGTLDPGEIANYPLPAGQHSFESVGLTGGGGCSMATVIIVECATESRVCKY